MSCVLQQALNLAAEVLTSELRQAYDSRGTAALPASRYSFLLDFLKQGRCMGQAHAQAGHTTAPVPVDTPFPAGSDH